MSAARQRFASLSDFLLRPLDPTLALILCCLLAYTFVVMASASVGRLESLLLHIMLAMVLIWIVASIPPQRLLSFAPALYILGVVLLVGVDLFGETSKGAKRWLNLGFGRFQPSELMKIAMPMTLAWFFQKREGSTGWQDFLIAIIVLALPVFLIVKQPDLGTAVLVSAAGVFVLFFAGLPWKVIGAVLVTGLLAIFIFVQNSADWCKPEVQWPGMKQYQKERVCTMHSPKKDLRGKGFHINQSTIAIGSGGFSGKGWREGTQTHLSFLPERHTDFIFAVIAEEFGFMGALVLLGLYLALLIRGFIIAATAPSLGTKLLAGAVTMIFFTYVFVNIGMVSGLLPVVGVPLPFVSYGGTALVTLCLGIGILMSIRHSWQDH
ncbi:MAG: rod shape-determining protein RodA [Azoarcus sp.]|jgi:rod shape determining protein RodA|nr:rod shape-determining protein RodA [Azoarcus sp.]